MKKNRIMICDDDQSILDVLQMLLESEDFEVIAEIDSTQLISKMQTYSPDILLLDLWMPVLTGDEVLKSLRQIEEFKFIPVIVLSASVNAHSIAQGAGATDFLPKPFDMDDLILKIKQLLQNPDIDKVFGAIG